MEKNSHEMMVLSVYLRLILDEENVLILECKSEVTGRHISSRRATNDDLE